MAIKQAGKLLQSYFGFHTKFNRLLNNNRVYLSSDSTEDTLRAFRRAYDVEDNPLKLELDSEESKEQGTLIPRIDPQHIGMASLLGRRETNEDRLLACKLSPYHLVAGIFDGHGGAGAADFAKATLPTCIQSQLVQLWSVLSRSGQSHRAARPHVFEPLLTSTFLQVNNLLSRHFFHYGTERERYGSGSTATVVLLRHGHQLIVGHVGDSRAILYRSGRVYPLTVDHVPDSLDNRFMTVDTDGDSSSQHCLSEVDRIMACGGTVSTNSLGIPVVNGRLGMTRSLGDLPLKAVGVTARPYVTSMKIRHSNASFLAIVSDGITHVMSDREIVHSITSCRTPHDAAQFLCDTALHSGSEDNASAVIIPFGSWGKIPIFDHRDGPFTGAMPMRIRSDRA